MPETPAKKAAASAKKVTEPTRRKRSLKEKAEEALRIEQDRVTALTERRDRISASLREVEGELATSTKRRDFLAMDPALEAPAENPGAPVAPTGGADA